jgi:DNA-binding CsgD family transcriptional regulator
LRFRAALDQATRRLERAVHPLVESGPDGQDRCLTAREREVLALVATGRTNSMIGTILGIAERTVRKHLTNAYAKLQISNRTAAALWYQRTVIA